MSNPYDPYPSPGESGDGGSGQPSGQNPYGQTPYGQNPSDQNPYDPTPSGQTPQNPYGADPYGSPQPYGQQPYGNGGSATGPYEPPAKTDALSIVAFVLSLTCCLSVVGAILGGIGLTRTGKGKRKGRWAAVSALVIGIIGTLIAGAVVIGVVFVAKRVVTPDNATRGECVDVTESSDNDSGTDSSGTTVSLFKRGCDGTHDAEIVFVGTYGTTVVKGTSDDAESICRNTMPQADSSQIGDTYTWDVVASDPQNLTAGDKFVCYVRPQDGSSLTRQLLN